MTSNGRLGFRYSEVRLAEEQQFSVYNFELADVAYLSQAFDANEHEAQRLIDAYHRGAVKAKQDVSRFPVLAAYDHVLKCSHLFNLLDAKRRHQRYRARGHDRPGAQAGRGCRRSLGYSAGHAAGPKRE